MRHTTTALIAVTVLSLVGCSTAGGQDKAGPRSTTISIAVGDRSGSPAHQIAQLFASKVAERTSGAVRVDVKATDGVALPAEYATSLITSHKVAVDGVAVATRAWGPAGVTSLEPLEVPMLVSSDPALDVVVADPVADRMHGGVRAAGFEPLALVPIGLRLVESYGASLSSPEEFRGATIRTWPSSVAATSLRALGAAPVWVGGFDFEEQARSGKLTGALAVLDPHGPNVVDVGTFTANVPVYADVLSLTLTKPAWSRLDDHTRTALREAAAATRESWMAQRLTLDEGASQACRAGFGVSLVDGKTLAAFRRGFAGVEVAVGREPGNADAIARIRALSADVGAPSVTPCDRTSTGTSTAGAGAGDQRILDGVWRTDVPLKEWLARGLPENAWPTNGGVHTLTFADGGWRDHDNVVGNPPDGAGTFVIEGDRVTLVLSDGSTVFSARFKRDGDSLVFSNVTQSDLAALWAGQWQRAG